MSIYSVASTLSHISDTADTGRPTYRQLRTCRSIQLHSPHVLLTGSIVRLLANSTVTSLYNADSFQPFQRLRSLAVASDGSVYVCDPDLQRVVKLTKHGQQVASFTFSRGSIFVRPSIPSSGPSRWPCCRTEEWRWCWYWTPATV